METNMKNLLDIEILQFEIQSLKIENESLQSQINAIAKYLDSIFVVIKDLNLIISKGN
jgi:FtsZ-binding cell division protein ZapB